MYTLYVFDNAEIIDVQRFRNENILYQVAMNYLYVFSDPDYPDYTPSDGADVTQLHCVSVDRHGTTIEYSR